MAKIGITKNNPKYMLEILKEDYYYIFTNQNVAWNFTRPKQKLTIGKG